MVAKLESTLRTRFITKHKTIRTLCVQIKKITTSESQPLKGLMPRHTMGGGLKELRTAQKWLICI